MSIDDKDKKARDGAKLRRPGPGGTLYEWDA